MNPEEVRAHIRSKEVEERVFWFSMGAVAGVLYMLAVVFICTRVW